MKIGLLSDSHGYIGPEVLEIVHTCDEIWHAGDIGDVKVVEQLRQAAPLVAVYGNIDDHLMRREFPENQWLEREGLRILITHIAGSWGKYNPRVRKLILEGKPDIVVCGHSHILKVIKDNQFNHLHLNPGAVGQHGFHPLRTMLTFTLSEGKIQHMAAVEFGRRGALTQS